MTQSWREETEDRINHQKDQQAQTLRQEGLKFLTRPCLKKFTGLEKACLACGSIPAPHARTRTHTRARTCTRARAHTYTRAHARTRIRTRTLTQRSVWALRCRETLFSSLERWDLESHSPAAPLTGAFPLGSQHQDISQSHLPSAEGQAGCLSPGASMAQAGPRDADCHPGCFLPGPPCRVPTCCVPAWPGEQRLGSFCSPAWLCALVVLVPLSHLP
jgi:hypothetical protein